MEYSRPLFHPDDQSLLVSCGSLLHKVSLESGLLQNTLHGRSATITAAVFDGDKFLITGFDNGSIIIWDLLQNVAINRFETDGPVHDIISSKMYPNKLIIVQRVNYFRDDDIVSQFAGKYSKILNFIKI